MLTLVLGNGILTNPDPVSHKRNPTADQPRVLDVADAAVLRGDGRCRADERWRRVPSSTSPTRWRASPSTSSAGPCSATRPENDAKSITDADRGRDQALRLGLCAGRRTASSAGRLPIAVKMQNAIASVRSTVERIVRECRAADRGRRHRRVAAGRRRRRGDALRGADARRDADLMLAGFETTANALSWTCWWLLDGVPEAAARLRRELDDVLGDALPTYDDLARLPYTTAVIAARGCRHCRAWMLERRSRSRSRSVATPQRRGRPCCMACGSCTTTRARGGTTQRSTGRIADQRRRGVRPRGARAAAGGLPAVRRREPNLHWRVVRVGGGRAGACHARPPVGAGNGAGQQVGTWAAVTLRPDPGIRMRPEPAPTPVRADG